MSLNLTDDKSTLVQVMAYVVRQQAVALNKQKIYDAIFFLFV